MFRNIKKLIAGPSLTLDVAARSIHIEQYWDVPQANHY